MNHIVNPTLRKVAVRIGLLAVACALVAACQDRRDPVRPNVAARVSARPLA